MKLNNFFRFALFVFVGISQSLVADDDSAMKMIEETILKELREARPDLGFGDIKPSPIDGYYEVSIENRQTVYVSQDGKHFFSGELYFAEPGRFVNATEMARSEKRLASLANVPESDMIIFKPESGSKAVMTVFTDVTCGYCRKLHNQMAEMNDLGIEVRYLAYPRSGIERDGEYTRSYTETAKAWCAEDRLTAMGDLKNGVHVSDEVCSDNPLEAQFELGQLFGVSGTPAIVLPDGTLLPGYRSPAEYAAILGIAAQ